MGYVAGETILDDEFNTFVNSSSSPFGYNHFAGTGSTVYGLGQTHIITRTAGDTVTASQWNSLFTGMDNIANHTNDTLTSTAARSAGDTIAIKSALVADLASLAAEVAGGSTSASGGLTTSAALEAASASGAWSTSHVVEFTVTFASNNSMRHFFNGGGKVRVVADRTGNGGTGGGATSKDTDWSTLLAAVGNLDINSLTSTRSGSGETLTTNGLANGFRDLSTGYTVLIKLTADTSPYTANYAQVSAKLNAAPDSATIMTIKYELMDDAADTTYTSGNTDGVDATPDRVGVTRVQLYSININTSEGLASVIAPSADATASNTTS